MEQFTANFLVGLATNLTTEVIKFILPNLKRLFEKSPKQKALERCFHAGIVALVASARTKSESELILLQDIFEKFFRNENVCFHIAGLLRGQNLPQNELIHYFKEEGFVPETLPGIQVKTAFMMFEGAFIEAATQEPELQGIIQTNALRQQLQVQQELLDVIKDFIRFWKRKPASDLFIQNGIIVFPETARQKPATYKLPLIDPFEGDWETHYLNTLIKECDPLDLSPIDASRIKGALSDENETIRISDVFTRLYLKNLQRSPKQKIRDVIWKKTPAFQSEDKKEKLVDIQAIEAVDAVPRLVILGQPGAGKSTLVNHLTTQLARLRLDRPLDENDLKGWSLQAKLLPVRIILRRLAAWLPLPAPPEKAGLIWGYLEKQCEQMGCQDAFPLLRRKLLTEGGIIFFDGLDEVSETDELAKRTIIREAIEAFSAPLEKCRIIITCREYAYHASDSWRLPEKQYPVVELALFNLEQIEYFVHTWYQVVGPQKGWDAEKYQREAHNLFMAVKEWPYLRELAQYPLLLTLMSQVHGRDGYLPQDRADLYQRAVYLLLAHWENRIIRDELGRERQVESDLVLRLEIRTDVILSALEKVAFLAHERQESEAQREERAADIRKEELFETLHHELKSYDTANTVIQYIQKRAGLLQARDNFTYTFPHRTFQEYLTATYLLKQAEFDDMLAQRIKLDLNWWREVFLLAAGASRKTPRLISNLIDALIFQVPPATEVTLEKMEWILLAAQALDETEFLTYVQKEKLDEPGRYTATYEKILTGLITGMTADSRLKPKIRTQTGVSLGHLGDPRLEVTTLERIQFCFVPAGPFWMGSPEDDKMGWEFERLLHQLELPYDYWISRYPITNAQFQEFVKDENGYQDNAWWTADGLQWRGKTHPYKYGGVFELPNHPVVGVSWYEALAFTRDRKSVV